MPLTKTAIEQAKTLAEIVAMINRTFVLAREAREMGDAALLRTAIERRRQLERAAGRQLLLAGPMPDGLHLSPYQRGRYLALAQMSDEKFDRDLKRLLAHPGNGANGNLTPAIRMRHGEWYTDEWGNRSREVTAADPAPTASQVQV